MIHFTVTTIYKQRYEIVVRDQTSSNFVIFSETCYESLRVAEDVSAVVAVVINVCKKKNMKRIDERLQSFNHIML